MTQPLPTGSRRRGAFVVFALASSLALAAQDRVQLNTISKVEVKGATVEITGSRRPSFTTFTLTDPPRLVIDLSEAVFAGVPTEQKVGDGTITAIKIASYGSESAAIARVLVGFEKELETDIVANGNQLVIKLPLPGQSTAQVVAQVSAVNEAADKAAREERERFAREDAARKKAEAEESARKVEAERQAKANLVYTPDPGYYYTGSNLEYLSVVVSDAENASNNVSTLVEIMVLDTNGFPTMSGPGDQNAEPETELVVTGGYQVDDEDNDEDVDGAQADPPVAPPDPVDGANSDMLLVGILECGSAIVANSGFHFQGGTFQQDDGSLSDLLDIYYDVNNDPLMAQVVTAIENGINAIDPAILSTNYTTSNPSIYTTAFAGIGAMSQVRYALDELTFLHFTPNDTCTLLTVVSDLGNNGLPFQYVGSPPDGFEIPIPGFAVDSVTFTLGALPQVDASFAGGAFVLEGDSAQATINITPATHPAFPLHFTVLSGTAISTSDFPQLIDLTINVPENATSVVVDNNTFGDTDPEGDETFTFQIVAPTDPPPGAFTRPAGWEVTTNVATAPMVLVDDDDGDNMLNVSIESTATINEGDTGPVTISISPASHPAFALEINSADGTATAPGDYTAQNDQVVLVPANATSVDVDFITIENLTDAPDKDFFVTLAAPTPPPSGYAIRARQHAVDGHHRRR